MEFLITDVPLVYIIIIVERAFGEPCDYHVLH